MQTSAQYALLFSNLLGYAVSSFFLESCVFSVELSCVCYLMFYNLQCRGRAVTNVVRTCGPTPLLYYKEQ